MDLESSKKMTEFPIDYEWTVSEDRLISLKDSVTNDSIRSDVFSAFDSSGVKYCLRIYPNGHNDKMRGKTFVSLHLELGNQKKIESEFTLSIKSANWSRKFDYVYEKSIGWGMSCCATDELFDANKKFIVDGKLTVKVEGILKIEKSESNETRKILKAKRSSTKNFSDLWNIGFDDCTVIADSIEIRVHKIVIACHSPVLAEKLKNDTENIVEISDFSFEIVEKAMKFCYQQLGVSDISVDEAIQLFKFTVKYSIETLKENLEEYLCEKITVFNFSEIANNAIGWNALELQNRCLDFFVECLLNKTDVPNMGLLDKNFLITAITKYNTL